MVLSVSSPTAPQAENLCSTTHRRQQREPGSVAARRPDDQRASDAERDAVVDRLRGDAAAGRLDLDELTRRTDAALGP